MIDLKRLSGLLPNVQKPARYTGGEYGEVVKPAESGAVRFALCFPDVYEVGMSHLGSSILYHLINGMDGAAAERCFAPWPDMEAALRQAGLPLYALETKTPLCEFDIVGFSLGYEMGYTNVLAMLDLGGIPLKAAQRGQDIMPLVIAGGGCAYNPEPMADFFDLFVIGEGEEVLPELIELYRDCRAQGVSKSDMLLRAAGIGGVYVPFAVRRGVRCGRHAQRHDAAGRRARKGAQAHRARLRQGILSDESYRSLPRRGARPA